jgi:hypothetical protein
MFFIPNTDFSLTCIYASVQHGPKSCDRVPHQPNPTSQTASQNGIARNLADRCSPLEFYTGHTERDTTVLVNI